jgi:hypothetical protein
MYPNDTPWTDNPLKSFLDFRLVDEEGNDWSLTWDAEKKQYSPSIAVNFTYKQRAPEYGGGAWALSINDPTFSLIETLSQVYGFVGGNFEDYAQGAALGKVKFRFGYTTSKKEVVYPNKESFVHGYIINLRPNIRHRSKMDFLLSGFDLNVVDINQGIVVSRKMLSGTLDSALNRIISAIEANDGASKYEIEYADEDLPTIDLGDTFSSNPTASQEPHLNAYFNGNGNIPFTRMLQFLQDAITGQGVMVYIYLSGTVKDGTQLIKVTRNRMTGAELPEFNVNSTIDSSGKPNESRIVNFDPSVMPITTGLLGGARAFVAPVDLDTLEQKAIYSDVTNNKSVSATTGLYSLANISAYAGDEAQSMGAEAANEYMRVRQAYLANMVIHGTIKVKFTPYLDLRPFDFISIKVHTPSGVLFFTSGEYMVKEIDHTLSIQSLDTTYTVITSGTRSVQNTEVNAGEVNNYE